jgi:DNA mismatch endonuclease (patch repair protein)
MSRAKESWASSNATRRSMQANKGRDTSPELAVRRLLHASGLRYRVNLRPVVGLRRSADVVFTRRRLAVLIDGCFWHGCPAHYERPAINRSYWDAKVTRNRERDEETNAALVANGWRVLRFWEHEVVSDPHAVVKRIQRELDDLAPEL